jgi:hypothetical protein
MVGYVGLFPLATRVEGRPAGTTDARVLLCGSVGAVRLLELGYTGPLIRRPQLAESEGAHVAHL